MNLEKIEKKLNCEKVKSVDEAKNVLSMEELIFYISKKNQIKTVPGSECQIAEIFKIFEDEGYSVRHSLQVLDATKEIIQFLSEVRY